jgi:glycosyltransferase involved in cell wall biosynthesis
VRRVLVLAYYFPPLGGAGVQRTVKLLKHLPALGYEPVVVTGPVDASVAWAPPDASLARELPAGLAVHRVDGPHPAVGKWSGRADRWLDRPDRVGAWWSRSAEHVARSIERVELVYATMSPFETATAARAVAATNGVPWVADLRDPWALDEWTVYSTAVHRRRDVGRMAEGLSSAAAVIANTPEAGRAMAREFPSLADRISVVPNGWDVEDFAGTGFVGQRPAANETFRIVYVGYSHVESEGWRRVAPLRRYLGGTTEGLHVPARSHLYLLRAIDELERTDPELAARIEVHLAGPSASSAHDHRVHGHGYLPHAAAIELVRTADLLFLPMHDLPVGVRARTVPGKTYEYLASGRQILAALPDGDARDILSGLAHVRVCRPRDVECLAEGIRAAAAAQLDVPADPPEIAWSFERRRLAERIAGVFDSVLGASHEATG